MDLALGGALLILSAPVQAIIALSVRLGSPGPILYGSRRTGLNGATITVIKFRTMQVDADTVGPAVSASNDPRITKIGKILRETRLDELPQLWNVLRGDMSLVGPRPEDPRFVAMYTPEQRRALSVRPGITGRAQLVFRNERDLLSTADPEATYIRDILPRKTAIDIEYAENHDLVDDVAILVKTLAAFVPQRVRPARKGTSGSEATVTPRPTQD